MVNKHRVWITQRSEEYHLYHRVNSSDDMEFEASFPVADLPNFLKRHNIKSLKSVDEFMVIDEKYYQRKLKEEAVSGRLSSDGEV